MQAMNHAVRSYTRRNRRHAQYPMGTRALLAFLKAIKAPVALVQTQLEATIIRADGTREELGVISRRVITTAGVNFIVSAHQNTVELELLNFHAMGTGGTAEAIGDTALVTEVETRTSGTQSAPAGNQYRTIGTVTATAIRAITEHGLFSASTVGTLFDRSLFSVINLAIGDAIQFTHTTTYTAGG